MPTLTAGANAPLPAGVPDVTLRLTTERTHADLVVLCVRSDGTADGDDGVALWSSPSATSGAVTIDVATDNVRLWLDRLPDDIQRLLVRLNAPDRSALTRW